MFRHISAVLLVVGLAAAPNSPAEAVSSQTENLAAIIVADHNEVRAEAGLEPLSWFDPLSHYSVPNSELMAQTGAITHPNLNTVMEEFQSAMWAGENTAVMFEPATEATAIWMGSPAHAQVLMAPYATHIHASVTCSADGRLWATVIFLEDSAAPELAPGAPSTRVGADARCARPFEPFRSSPDFVAQQYRDLLGREPEQKGIDYWVIEIENGRLEPTQLIAALMNSPEFGGQIAPIIRLHIAGSGQLPSAQEMKASIALSKAGTTQGQLADQILASPAGIAAYGNLGNEQFVQKLHQQLLERPAPSEELDHWRAQLDAGMTRGALIANLTASPEFHRNSYATVEVYMAYVGMLDRAPDAKGLGYWAGIINDGGSLDALLHGFISSTEYRNRF